MQILGKTTEIAVYWNESSSVSSNPQFGSQSTLLNSLDGTEMGIRDCIPTSAQQRSNKEPHVRQRCRLFTSNASARTYHRLRQQATSPKRLFYSTKMEEKKENKIAKILKKFNKKKIEIKKNI